MLLICVSFTATLCALIYQPKLVMRNGPGENSGAGNSPALICLCVNACSQSGTFRQQHLNLCHRQIIVLPTCLDVYSVQFRSKLHLRTRENSDALRPVSLKFPHCCLSNNSNVRLTAYGPFSSVEERFSGASFYSCLLQKLCGVTDISCFVPAGSVSSFSTLQIFSCVVLALYGIAASSQVSRRIAIGPRIVTPTEKNEAIQQSLHRPWWCQRVLHRSQTDVPPLTLPLRLSVKQAYLPASVGRLTPGRASIARERSLTRWLQVWGFQMPCRLMRRVPTRWCWPRLGVVLSPRRVVLCSRDLLRGENVATSTSQRTKWPN